MVRGTISSLAQLQHVLPDPCDHQLEAALITELFASSYLSPISIPETLVAQGLEHFEYFDDPDLKCRPTLHTLYVKTDFSGFKVTSMSVLHIIIQPTDPHFLMPYTFLTWLYPWQLHLETQKDIPKH